MRAKRSVSSVIELIIGGRATIFGNAAASASGSV
jgi:hypothetical protein